MCTGIVMTEGDKYQDISVTTQLYGHPPYRPLCWVGFIREEMMTDLFNKQTTTPPPSQPRVAKLWQRKTEKFSQKAAKLRNAGQSLTMTLHHSDRELLVKPHLPPPLTLLPGGEAAGLGVAVHGQVGPVAPEDVWLGCWSLQRQVLLWKCYRLQHRLSTLNTAQWKNVTSHLDIIVIDCPFRGRREGGS